MTIGRMTRIGSQVGTVLLVAALMTWGCGEHTVAVPLAAATPTPGHTGPPHSLMRVGSAEPNGGALAVDTVPPALLVESACVGGTGHECTGGTVVYNETSPGFNAVTADDPSLPVYVLPDGVEVSLELTAVDPDASVIISGVVLNTVGQAAVVNTTPELHNHPTWQMVAPGGTLPGEKHIVFRLHAAGYEPSAEIAVTLSVFEGDGDGHDHEDD